MALCMSATLVACGGGNKTPSGGNSGGPSSAETGINVLLVTGTATRNGAIKWIQDAAARFTELKKDESYESGKKGVDITTASVRMVTISISMKQKRICTLIPRLTSLCSSTKS